MDQVGLKRGVMRPICFLCCSPRNTLSLQRWTNGTQTKGFYRMKVSLPLSSSHISCPDDVEVVYVKMMHAFAGFYLWVWYEISDDHSVLMWGIRWEYAISLDFEWSLLTGQKKLRWPMVCGLSCAVPKATLWLSGYRSPTSSGGTQHCWWLYPCA